MSKKLIITIPVLLAVLLGIFLYLNQNTRLGTSGELQQIQYVPGTQKEFSGLAEEISKKINELSPTRSFDDTGWIAVRISFVEEQALAYVEYTDTHVALRLLIQYGRSDGGLVTKALATFIPLETGGWELQYGRDIAADSNVYHYRYDGDAKQWIPEQKSETRNPI